VLRELFAEVGSGAYLEPPFHCDYGRHITAGRNLYMNFGCVVLDCNRVRFGDDVSLGPHVQIVAATHPVDPDERARGPELGRPVTIGHRVWIGAGAIVCPGVTIGDGSTIGAGSVVVKSIPPRSVAVGNPCRVVRTL
jgi:maltose O-acetyltransferase